MLPGGSYGVTAHYAGNGTYGASDSTPPVQVTVNPEGSQTHVALLTFDPTTGLETSSNATSLVYGSSLYLLRADVTNSSGQPCFSNSYPCPTGQVTLTDNGQPLDLGTYKLNSQGYTEDQTIQLAGGQHNIVASYSGDGSYNTSTSPTDTITVTAAPTTVTASTSSCETPIQYGLPCQINALINTTSVGVSPSGSVTFFVNGAQQGSPVPAFNSSLPNRSGNTPYAWAQGSDDLQFLTIGTDTFSAEYSGDTNYQAAASAPVSITVTKDNGGVSVFTGPPIQLGQQAALQAQAFGAPPPAAVPTGTITFYDGGNAIGGSVTYSVNNTSLFASLSYTPTTGGNHTITASYSGDSDYASSTSSPATLTVQAPDFQFSYGEVPGNLLPGQSGTATVFLGQIDGFTGTVNLTCAVTTAMSVSPSDMPTCTPNPTSVTFTPSSASIGANVVLSTVAPSLAPPGNPPAGPRRWPIAVWIVMLGLAVVAAVYERRIWSAGARRLESGSKLPRPIAAGHRPALQLAALAALLLLVELWVSCGGGGGGGGVSTSPSNPGTPAGNYTVTVTGTSGSLTHSMTWTLTVE